MSEREVGFHRGFSILVSMQETLTTWIVEARTGTFKGNDFISNLPPLKREFQKQDGALSCTNAMVELAKEKIDEYFENRRLTKINPCKPKDAYEDN